MIGPAVSVIMPVRNCASTVDLAIRSIVEQTLSSWELVIVDDGSTDGTELLLERWADRDDRIRVHIDGSAKGISARLNEAVGHARADLVARMDGDDISLPHRLAVQVEFLRSHPEVDLVGAGEMVFTSGGALRGFRVGPTGHDEIVADVLRGIPVSHPTWVGRRAWFVRNPYASTASACEDQELLLRAHTTSRYANVPDVLLAYREDRIKLGRSIAARLASAAFLIRYGRAAHALLPSAVAAVDQLARGARDAAAVLLGWEEQIMRRRVAAARPCDEEAWRGWRSAVIEGVGPH